MISNTFDIERRFRRRIDEALAAIGRALQCARRPYVAFSGGKDSLALLCLVHSLNPAVPFAWSDDELELPETVAYMQMIQAVDADGLFTVRLATAVHAGWFRPWEDAPFWREPLPGSIPKGPTRSEWAHDSGYDLVFTGLRMRENRRRRDWLGQTGPIYRAKTVPGAWEWRCCPLWDWSADDVWHLIHERGLPYNRVYDVFERIGVHRHAQRVGPLPLARRVHLAEGWPDTLSRLEVRYGRRWED